MSYAIIQPKQPFRSEEVKVKGNYIDSNKLWKINEGDKLLHYSTGETGFLREIGLDSMMERVTYVSFTKEEFQTIVQYFFQRGELRLIDFESVDDFAQDEANYLIEQLKPGNRKVEHEVVKFMKDYVEITEDFLGEPWYLTLYREKKQIKVYRSGVIYVSVGKNEHIEELVLGVYQEIFNLLDKPFILSSVTITEKEKIIHPLTNAHNYLSEVFRLSGEEARQQLGLSNEEVETIQKLLLKNTKKFENETIYK